MKRATARRVWAIVPAAGRGARFAASTPASAPKQYAPLQGATVLEWSLRALLAEPRVHAVVVALAPDDAHWPHLAARLSNPKLQVTIGWGKSPGFGDERLGVPGGPRGRGGLDSGA